jgi:hypothetical protein
MLLLCLSPTFLSCPRLRSQDSIANGALVIARLQLATGIRPVGRKAQNVMSDSESTLEVTVLLR